MARVWIVTVLLAAVLVVGARAANRCAITQNCHDGSLDSKCHAIAYPHDPQPMNFSGIACPQYKDSACCNHYQNQYLSFNFFLIRTAFGTGSGGCSACAQNLEKFWCDFTCAPNQAEFLHPLGLEKVSDPATGAETTVLHMTLDINTDFACGVYASCQDTTHARQVQTMKTCNGFLDYQGQYEAIGRGNYIQFNYTDAPTAMNFPPDNCANFTNSTGQQDSCECGACAAACFKNKGANSLANLDEEAAVNPLHGANWVAVGALYGSIAAVSILLVGARWFRSRQEDSPPKSQRAGFADVLQAVPVADDVDYDDQWAGQPSASS